MMFLGLCDFFLSRFNGKFLILMLGVNFCYYYYLFLPNNQMKNFSKIFQF